MSTRDDHDDHDDHDDAAFAKAHLGTSPIRPGVTTHPHHPRLHDCRLICSDGTVDANTFCMVQASRMMATMFEDMPETPDDPADDQALPDAFERLGIEDARVTKPRIRLCQRRSFDLRSLDTRTVQGVVDLLERRVSAADIGDIDHLRAVLLAMDFLDCDLHWVTVVDRLWNLIQQCPKTTDTIRYMLENASLIIPEHPSTFFHRFRALCPDWTSFRRVFETISMTPTLAVVVMTQLMTYFPVPLLIHAIVMHTPTNHVCRVITDIFKLPRIGSYVHPDELLLVFDLVLRKASRDIDTSMIRAVLESTQGVNTPIPTPRIGGSMVTFQTKNTASFAFVMDRPITRPKTLAFSSNTASCTFDPARSRIETEVKLHKFNETGAAVECIYVRTTVYPRDPELDDGHISTQVAWDRVYDRWTTVWDVDHDANGLVRTHDTLPAGALGDRSLYMIRIDIFWVHDPRTM